MVNYWSNFWNTIHYFFIYIFSPSFFFCCVKRYAVWALTVQWLTCTATVLKHHFCYMYSASSFKMPLCPQILDKLGKFVWLWLHIVRIPPKHGHTKLFYLTMHIKPLPWPCPFPHPNLTRKNVVFSLWEKHCYFKMCYFAQLKIHPFSNHWTRSFGFLTLNNCADLSFNTFSTLKTMKIYTWFMSYSKIAPIIEL